MRIPEFVFDSVFQNIDKLSKDEKCDVYWKLNRYEWDERLGKKPEGYDDLPPYNFRLLDKLLMKPTKCDYVTKIMRDIEMNIPHRTLYRYLHLESKKDMTETEFDDWYQSTFLKRRRFV